MFLPEGSDEGLIEGESAFSRGVRKPEEEEKLGRVVEGEQGQKPAEDLV